MITKISDAIVFQLNDQNKKVRKNSYINRKVVNLGIKKFFFKNNF